MRVVRQLIAQEYLVLMPDDLGHESVTWERLRHLATGQFRLQHVLQLRGGRRPELSSAQFYLDHNLPLTRQPSTLPPKNPKPFICPGGNWIVGGYADIANAWLMCWNVDQALGIGQIQSLPCHSFALPHYSRIIEWDIQLQADSFERRTNILVKVLHENR